MSFTINHLGQNCFYFNMDGFKLLIDPYFSDSCEAVSSANFKFIRRTPVFIPADEIDADFVYCTHDHLDHLDPETIPHIKNATFAGPSSCAEHYKKLGLEDSRIKVLDRGESMEINGCKLTSVYAEHTPDSCGLIIEYDGKKVYNVGDGVLSDKLFDSKDMNIDLILVPINGKLGNLNPEEAARLSKELKVKAAVPCHYDMFADNSEDPEKFNALLKGTGIRYLPLELNREYEIEELLI